MAVEEAKKVEVEPECLAEPPPPPPPTVVEKTPSVPEEKPTDEAKTVSVEESKSRFICVTSTA